MENDCNLQRFLNAQRESYDIALAEIQAGQKCSHWMWYIFPQCKGLGRSPTSAYYGISSIEEARAYLADPVLDMRLTEICSALLAHTDKTAEEIFGSTDAMKLRSSMTLFHLADPENPVFTEVLRQFSDGKTDKRTERIMGIQL